jgi:hypothetical protein
VPLPVDIDAELVALRNRVLHDAYSPTRAEAVRAGEIVKDLVSDVRGGRQPLSLKSAGAGFRPQRADLTIFQGSRKP